MSEKTETGTEVMDPLETKKEELYEIIKTHKKHIQELHYKIKLFGRLQVIFGVFSGVKVVNPDSFLVYGSTIEVSLPDLETLGAFFRELEHLKSEMPHVKINYSGKLAKDEILAKVEIQFED